MFKKNVHVGRPSNEEIRNRRIKKSIINCDINYINMLSCCFNYNW